MADLSRLGPLPTSSIIQTGVIGKANTDKIDFTLRMIAQTMSAMKTESSVAMPVGDRTIESVKSLYNLLYSDFSYEVFEFLFADPLSNHILILPFGKDTYLMRRRSQIVFIPKQDYETRRKKESDLEIFVSLLFH